MLSGLETSTRMPTLVDSKRSILSRYEKRGLLIVYCQEEDEDDFQEFINYAIQLQEEQTGTCKG
jgi:hypothetical protein